MSRHAVVTPHHLSAGAAREVLNKGGNAVDAAIAAIAAQGVVAPETCGLGGDLFALVHKVGWDRPRTLNSSGRSGSNADPSVLRSAGRNKIPEDDPLAVTIPGCVDGLTTLSGELGSFAIGESLQPAIALAVDGFDVSTEQAATFARRASTYRENQAVADFYPDGAAVARGDHVTRSDLATTLMSIADGGRAAFYQGKAGQDIIIAVDGLITDRDLERVNAQWVDPIGADVAGMTAWTIPPNTQGYLGPGTLAVFEMLEPPDDPEDPLWWHLLIEAYRCLAWERDDIVADPDSAPLPGRLMLDHDRLTRAAETVSPETTGTWPNVGSISGTAYMCVADNDGMAVSIIQSNYRGTGSPYGAARGGFLLQDRGLGFTLTPGHPNELLPGKRPLHTLAPTLWTDETGPRWVLGTRGGAVQPQLLAQVAARAILGSTSLEESQASPRWTISNFGPNTPSHVAIEPGVSEAVVAGLMSRGHQIDRLVDEQPGWGPVSIIEFEDGDRRAAADPRVDTATALVWGETFSS